jgi:hypothetical protein
MIRAPFAMAVTFPAKTVPEHFRRTLQDHGRRRYD